MKILHTSDWHLGHTLYNYDRTAEQVSMLRQMAAIVSDHKPDVFLLSGDVYHTSQPSAAVQKMFANALVDIHRAHPQMTIVVTAGNHDSGSRHEIFSTPWEALKVHAIGTLSSDHTDHHIIPIPGKGYVVAVPYTHERNIPEGFFQTLLDEVARQNTERLPVVMSAHTTVRGSDFTGHDQVSDYIVGGIDTIDVEQMGRGYDYLALGHIHHAQFVHTGRHHVRYSGSPIPVSFDEAYPHTVSMVEIDAHDGTPVVQEIAIQNPHPLVTLPTTGVATWEAAQDLLRQFPDDIPAYIRLNVEVDDMLPVEANAQAQALTHGKHCRFCYINAKRRTARAEASRVLTIQEFQSEKPIDIAARYAGDIGVGFDNLMREVFNEAQQMILEDSNND